MTDYAAALILVHANHSDDDLRLRRIVRVFRSLSHNTFVNSTQVPNSVPPTTEEAAATTSAAAASTASTRPTKSATAGVGGGGGTSPLTAHDLSIFRVHCRCVDCLKYREMLIQLLLEDFEYNTLWIRLQQLILRYYCDMVPDRSAAAASATPTPSTSAAGSNGTAKWIGDGRQLDAKKNIQRSLSSNLPLNHDMTFILVFSM